MKKEKQLAFARNLFAIIVFFLLLIIVLVEKGRERGIEKATKSIDSYLKTNYQAIEKRIDTEKVTYKNGIYSMKVVSKENKNLYFYIKKDKKKITDTYQKDYLQGNTLLKTLPNKLEKEIKEKTNTSPTVTIISTLDEHITSIQERIIKEENLLELKFYTLKKELLINDWSNEQIVSKIIDTMNTYESQNITPKNYTIVITNKNKITESIEIKNLTTDFIKSLEKEEIIEDIINDNNSKLLKENNITYKYLNEEE